MPDDLFFIPLISKALRQPAPKAALREALEQIEMLGQQRRYRRGYRQFLQLMDAVRTAQVQASPQQLAAAILQAVDPQPRIEILLAQADRVVAVLAFDRAAGVRSAGGIVPGQYQLKLDTGRVLWEGRLTEQHLIWAKAFPGRPLEMAADSHRQPRQATQELSLQDGAVLVRVYPGVEAGVVEVELTRQETQT